MAFVILLLFRSSLQQILGSTIEDAHCQTSFGVPARSGKCLWHNAHGDFRRRRKARTSRRSFPRRQKSNRPSVVGQASQTHETHLKTEQEKNYSITKGSKTVDCLLQNVKVPAQTSSIRIPVDSSCSTTGRRQAHKCCWEQKGNKY